MLKSELPIMVAYNAIQSWEQLIKWVETYSCEEAIPNSMSNLRNWDLLVVSKQIGRVEVEGMNVMVSLPGRFEYPALMQVITLPDDQAFAFAFVIDNKRGKIASSFPIEAVPTRPDSLRWRLVDVPENVTTLH